MRRLASFISKNSQQFQLPKLKQRQKASLSVLAFDILTAVQTSKISFQKRQNAQVQISPVCSIQHPCVLIISNSQNVILNSIIMHRLASLISNVFRQFQLFLENKFRDRTKPPSIFLFGVNFIFPTVRPCKRPLYCVTLKSFHWSTIYFKRPKCVSFA